VSKSPFVVPVGTLVKKQTSRHELRRGQIDDLVVSGSEVPVSSEVEVDVELRGLGRAVEALGVVRAPYQSECRRCLTPVQADLSAEVREMYEPDPVDDEAYPMVNDEIDLLPLAREAVLLELPQVVLCREDCAGLCPQCGIDLNEDTCSCEAPTDPRWAALEQLRSDDPNT
jgi:uncharacterized protein